MNYQHVQIVTGRQTGKRLTMRKYDVQIALEGVAEARSKWKSAKAEFDAQVNRVMARLLHEAAAAYMSAEEVAKASGLTVAQIRSMMRQHGLDPRSGKTLLGKQAAEALASNAELLGIPVHEMDLMSPLAYLPAGQELRQRLTDKAAPSVHEFPETDDTGYQSLGEAVHDLHLRGGELRPGSTCPSCGKVGVTS